MWIDPVIFSIGSFQIRWYGLVYVLGMLAAYWFLRKEHRRLALEKQEVEDLLLWMMLGLLAGARLFHFLFSDPSVFWKDPLELFRIWRGGMSFFGGLAGAVAGTYLFTRRRKTRLLAVADVMVIPASLALAFGRVANFLNQEVVGRVTDVSWCVNFDTAAMCRHPYQLYAALSHAVLFAILLYLKKSGLKVKTGTLFFSFTFLYGAFRFTTDFFRDDPLFMGLTVWQYLSLLLCLASVLPLLKRFSRMTSS